MKRTIILLIILMALIAAYFFLGKTTEDDTSIGIEDREFVLKNTDEVAVITLEYKAKPMIHLSNTNDGWFINNKQKANQRIVKNMLKTLSRMAIKYVPTQNENATAIRRMEQHGIDIVTYDKEGKIITEFTLGTSTSDEYGTYCMAKGANQSYVMSIPSIQGGIRNYFTQTQEQMRDMTVFAFRPNDIRSITLNYPKDQANSFTVSRDGIGFNMTTTDNSGVLNENIADAFFKDFSMLTSEFVRNDHTMKDSVINRMPFMEITVVSKERPDYSLSIYPTLDFMDSKVNTRSPDDINQIHERFFAYSNAGDFYFIQDHFMKPFIKKASYFYKKAG